MKPTWLLLTGAVAVSPVAQADSAPLGHALNAAIKLQLSAPAQPRTHRGWYLPPGKPAKPKSNRTLRFKLESAGSAD